MKNELLKLTDYIIKNSFMENFASGSHVEIDIINKIDDLDSYFNIKLLDDYVVYIHLAGGKTRQCKDFKLTVNNTSILIKYNNEDFFLCKIDDDYNVEITDIMFNCEKIVVYTKENTGYKLDLSQSILYEKIKRKRGEHLL